MGRRYATVDANLWNQTEFRKLSDDAQRLFFYLTTCPHSEADAYVLSQVVMCDDLQWDVGRINRAFQFLAKKPYVLYDPAARLVYVAEYWKASWNRIPNANVAVFIARHLYHLPNSPLKARAIDDLRATGWWAERVNAVFANWTYSPEQDDLPLDDRQHNLLPPETPKPKPERVKRESSRLPADWEPSEKNLAYARTNAIDNGALDYEVKNFRRYWSTEGKPMKDWDATWENAVDRAVKRASERGGHSGNNGSGNGSAATLPPSNEPDWAMRMKLYNGPKRVWLGAWGPKPGEPHCEVPPQFLAPPPQ